MKNKYLPYTDYLFHSRMRIGRADIRKFDWDRNRTRLSAPDQRENTPSLRFCKYCDNSLVLEEVFRENRHQWRRGDAAVCKNCGWWLYAYSGNEYHYFQDRFMPQETIRNELYQGTVFAFDIEQSNQPLTALRLAISRNKRNLRSLTPKELELLVGSCLRDYGLGEVHHIGGPNDGGFDLLFVEGERPIAVQVKQHNNPRPSESVANVRELLGSMLVSNIPKAIFVTTAERFSGPARRAIQSETIAQHGFEIDLYNYDRIRDILRLTLPPEEPWLLRLPENRLPLL